VITGDDVLLPNLTKSKLPVRRTSRPSMGITTIETRMSMERIMRPLLLASKAIDRVRGKK